MTTLFLPRSCTELTSLLYATGHEHFSGSVVKCNIVSMVCSSASVVLNLLSKGHWKFVVVQGMLTIYLKGYFVFSYFPKQKQWIVWGHKLPS
jgi:hypothetical protein